MLSIYLEPSASCQVHEKVWHPHTSIDIDKCIQKIGSNIVLGIAKLRKVSLNDSTFFSKLLPSQSFLFEEAKWQSNIMYVTFYVEC